MDIVIVSACRTPIGKFCGALMPKSAPELGAAAIRAAIQRAGIEPGAVDEVIMGNVVGAGLGQNPARQAAIFGGVPDSVPAMTINKVCGSGLKAVMLAAQAISCGDAEVVIAGGLESMSNTPYMLPKGRMGYRLGHGEVLDSCVSDGLWDVYNNYHMGSTAELVARECSISRAEQDAFAAESHRKAAAAIAAGKFKAEIVPVEIAQKKGPATIVDTDECVRADTTAEALGKLKPAFEKDGTVTAGNAPGITDGAAACVVMSARRAGQVGVKALARIVGYSSAAREPKYVMLAPVNAVELLKKRCGTTNDSYDLAELNEAFAVQALACTRQIGFDPAKVNVHGGAVALGHPIGASGCRILTTLIHALKDRGLKRGLASLCLGGGGAVAMDVELV
ncbi:acetyl-CoA C-acetyltransferase [Candidatus Poribacteria bacterium]|nr:acetyl-CoA C-acetyltransferase [Candidatus Poribacteria bacterium]